MILEFLVVPAAKEISTSLLTGLGNNANCDLSVGILASVTGFTSLADVTGGLVGMG